MSADARRHLAVIPARGGSKRLPRKNVIDFGGRPIIAATIESAREAGVFERVLVSTEDAEIAEVAQRHGAEIDKRPPELATDAATIVQVCAELLGRLPGYDTITVLYATAPLRNAGDIRATLALLEPGACDFAMAVSAFEQPFHQGLRLEENGALSPVFPELTTRRADSVGAFVAGNGSTYCANVAAFLRERSFYGAPLRGHVMPRERAIDIDTAEDLALAKFYAGITP